MTKQTYTSQPDHSTDAGFRAWGSQLSAAIAAAGLVKTTDTGQIDFTTVVRAAANASAGYEIWRFNDTLQATVPVFIRVEYWTGSSATTPTLRFSVGSATNGAGTLTGLVSQQFSRSSPSAFTATAPTWVANPLSGSAFICAWGMSNSTSQGMAFFVDRTRDSTGAATGDGLYIGSCFSGAQAVFEFHNRNNSQRVSLSQGMSLPPPWGATGYSGNFQVFPHFAFLPAPFFSLAVATYLGTDIASSTTISVALVGATAHTYVAIPLNSFMYSHMQTVAPTVWGTLLIWED